MININSYELLLILRRVVCLLVGWLVGQSVGSLIDWLVGMGQNVELTSPGPRFGRIAINLGISLEQMIKLRCP